jgi:hypothetical protein
MNKVIKYLLIIFLIADIGYSFYQHYHKPLDGDMSHIVLPTLSEGYYRVLQDPFGIEVITNDSVYPNPNRFFAHYTASRYFLNTPIILQKITNPIDSVYLSSAIAKTIIQILIIYLLAVFITDTRNIFKSDFLIAAALIAPLFQTADYNRYMGIIDQSVIYTFFYALPLSLLLLFFLPFFNEIYHNRKIHFNWFMKILMALFIIYLSLNGPLGPGVVLITCPLVLITLWWKEYKKHKTKTIYQFWSSLNSIPKHTLFYFTGICLISLYSLYLGENNSMNDINTISVIERYSRIPLGIYYIVTQKLGYPILLLMISINIYIIKRYYKTEYTAKLLRLISWIGVFAILYILLLPLGGYRVYRENVVRYDTIIPITIGVFFVFGSTAFFLIKNINGKRRSIYISTIIIMLSVFTVADISDYNNHYCEKEALKVISASSDSIVELNTNCPVMEWHTISNPKLSQLNAGLFLHWNITSEKKLYYHKN